MNKCKRYKAMPPYCTSKTHLGLLTSSLPKTLFGGKNKKKVEITKLKKGK